jgi:hypothetical protein
MVSASPEENLMVEQMPTKTAAELEIECLKVLKGDPYTRDIARVERLKRQRSQLEVQ